MPCDRATAPDALFTLRLRRIRRALEDLGITPIVGDRWATSTDDGIRFADLDETVSDRLARLLEDLIQQLADAEREPTWFFARRPPRLFTPTELSRPGLHNRSCIHPEVPR